MDEYLDWARATLEVREGIPRVVDEDRFREETVEPLIRRIVFHGSPDVRAASAWALRHAALQLGVVPASIHELYRAVGRGEAGGFTVPAFNLRGMTYEVARRLFRAARELDAGAFILELARSEMGYTEQSPAEYSAAVLAAAIREGFRGPVFLQGDHFQTRVIDRRRPMDMEVTALRGLIGQSLAAGFYNIDIDASPLVELDQPTVEKQQRRNVEATAYLARFVRRGEPEGVRVAIGAEVGEVGGSNTTVEELRAFMEAFAGRRAAFDVGTPGLAKISVQTGTVHGGRVLADGRLGEVRVDFDRLAELSRVAREVYGLGGVVQHGASTLPLELFSRFPRSGAIEIHLSTAFQNLVFEAPEFPRGLLEEMDGLLLQAFGDEKESADSREQFLYKNRKRVWGPFKRELWDLAPEVRDPILDRLQERFAFLLRSLAVAGTRATVERWVKPVPVPPPLPGAPDGPSTSGLTPEGDGR
jgi:fructose/tagatose bisphosphate aldolase